jgi:hypothetical protein
MKRREFLKSAAAAVSVISVSGCSNIDLFSGKKAKEPNFIISKDPIYIITNDEPVQWILQWRPDSDHVGPVNIEIRAHNMRSINSIKWKKIESLDGGGKLIWRTPESPTYNDIAAHNKNLAVGRFEFKNGISKNKIYRFAITGIPAKVAQSSCLIRLVAQSPQADSENDKPTSHKYSLDPKAMEIGEGLVSLKAYAGPAVSLTVTSRSAPQNDGRMRIAINPVDKFGFSSVFEKARQVTISSEGEKLWAGKIKEPKIVMLKLPNKDIVRLTTEFKDTENKTTTLTSNPIWTKSQRGKIPAFGDFHWHTEISHDAMRTMDQAMLAARDYANLDFVAPGDHTPKGQSWKTLVKSCDRFNDPDTFATVYGWEQSSDNGHVNFYFTDAEHPMNPNNFNYPTEPEKYIEILPYDNFIAIPHHTNAVSYALRDDGSHYWGAYPWGKPRDSYLRQIEVMQSRGSFEREDPPAGWRAEYRNNQGSAQVALAKGHKIGFIGGTDNHTGYPSLMSHGVPGKENRVSWIYTCAWIRKRTRQSVYDAVYDRHTWGCWDTRAIVLFEIESAMQGDELKLSGSQKLSARIKMSVEAPLDVLEIVTEDDRCICVGSLGDSLDIETQVDLGMVDKNTFFYLRARQTDGALIYASPIFVTV